MKIKKYMYSRCSSCTSGVPHTNYIRWSCTAGVHHTHMQHACAHHVHQVFIMHMYSRCSLCTSTAGAHHVHQVLSWVSTADVYHTHTAGTHHVHQVFYHAHVQAVFLTHIYRYSSCIYTAGTHHVHVFIMCMYSRCSSCTSTHSVLYMHMYSRYITCLHLP